MIRDPDHLRRFEDELLRTERLTFERSSRIFEALWEEARALGILPTEDPLEGIDVDIRLAKALHVQGSAGKNRPRA